MAMRLRKNTIMIQLLYMVLTLAFAYIHSLIYLFVQKDVDISVEFLLYWLYIFPYWIIMIMIMMINLFIRNWYKITWIRFCSIIIFYSFLPHILIVALYNLFA